MKVYFIETVYHLYLALMHSRLNDENILIIGSHRQSTLVLANELKIEIAKKFKKVIYVNKYLHPNNFTIQNLRTVFINYLKILRDIELILNLVRKEHRIYLFINITNKFERILINKVSSIKTDTNIYIIEDGIGSYNNIHEIFGSDFDRSFKNLFRPKNIVRALLKINLNPKKITGLFLTYPELANITIRKQIQIIPLEIHTANALNLKKRLSLSYASGLISNTVDSLFLYNIWNDDFENKFYYKYLKKFNIYQKFHPSNNKQPSYHLHDKSLEFYSLIAPPKIVISYASSSLISSIRLNKNSTTVFVFLWKIYHQEGENWFKFPSEITFFEELQKLYPKRIFIPSNIEEMNNIITNNYISTH